MALQSLSALVEVMKDFSLDTVDREVVAALQRDHRASNRALAELIGVREAVIGPRIDALVQKGVIKFTVQKDARAWGLPVFFYADVYTTGPGIDAVIKRLLTISEIFAVSRVHGPQLIIFGHVEDGYLATQRIVETIQGVEGLCRAEFSFVLKTFLMSATVGEGLSATTDVGEVDGADEMDSLIIDHLRRNGRLSNRAIARSLGVSESMIRKRLNRLESTSAIRFGLVVDASVLGYTASAWLRIRAEAAAIPSLLTFLKGLPQLELLTSTVGPYDIIGFIHASSHEQLHLFVEDELKFRRGVIEVDVRESREIVGYRNEYLVIVPDEI